MKSIWYEIYMGGCGVLSLEFDEVKGFYVFITV